MENFQSVYNTQDPNCIKGSRVSEQFILTNYLLLLALLNYKIQLTHASILPDLTLPKQPLSRTRIYSVSQNITPKLQFRTIFARNAHDFAHLCSYVSASYKTLAHDFRTISARLAHSHFLTQKIKTAYSQRVTFTVASGKFTKSAKIGKNSSSRAYSTIPVYLYYILT